MLGCACLSNDRGLLQFGFSFGNARLGMELKEHSERHWNQLWHPVVFLFSERFKKNSLSRYCSGPEVVTSMAAPSETDGSEGSEGEARRPMREHEKTIWPQKS